MSISVAPDDVASTFIATEDATGEAADTGITGGSSTASAGTSAASKGVQKGCDVCEEWYAIIPASVSSVDCLMYKQMTTKFTPHAQVAQRYIPCARSERTSAYINGTRSAFKLCSFLVRIPLTH